MTSKQVQQIFQYIQANGNFLGSEKVLKQVQKHQDMIWQILVRLSSKITDKNIENAFGQMSFLLQSQKHERSIKWLKDYMMIHDLACKTQSNYSILDYIRPQKDRIVPTISKIIQILKGTNKLKQDLDYQIVRNDIIAKDFIKFRALEESTTKQLHELRIRKQKELPLYEEKLKQKNQIVRRINDKKKEKLQRMEKQRRLQEQCNQKQKQSEQLDFQTSDQKFNIARLKRQVTINAPEVKKERRALEEEYSEMSQNFQQEKQIAKSKQKLLSQQIQRRNFFSDGMVDVAKKIIQVFQSLQDHRSRLKKVIDDYQRHQRNRVQLQKREDQLRQQIQKIKAIRNEQVYITRNAQTNFYKDKLNCEQKKTMNAELTRVISDIRTKNKKFQDFLQRTNQYIKQSQKRFQKRKRQIILEYKEWIMQTSQFLQKLKKKDEAHMKKLHPFNNPELLENLYELGQDQLMKKMDLLMRLQQFGYK